MRSERISVAAALLLAACGSSDRAEVGATTPPARTVPENPAAPGDQDTTPGGVAGETAATPPGSQEAGTSPEEEESRR